MKNKTRQKPHTTEQRALARAKDLPTAVGQLPHVWECVGHPITGAYNANRRAFVYDFPNIGARLKYAFARVALAAGVTNALVQQRVEQMAPRWIAELCRAFDLPSDRVCWGPNKKDGHPFTAFKEEHKDTLYARKQNPFTDLTNDEAKMVSGLVAESNAQSNEIAQLVQKLLQADQLVAILTEENLKLRSHIVKGHELEIQSKSIEQQEEEQYKKFNRMVGQAMVSGLITPCSLKRVDELYQEVRQSRSILNQTRNNIAAVVDKEALSLQNKESQPR